MASSSRPSGKRLPISCQACRNRKIRCSRDGRPCQTCVRRGLGAEDCIYLGQPRLSAEQTSPGESAVQSELLARIRQLESMLQMQGISQSGASPGSALSPQGAPSTSSFAESESGAGPENWDARIPMMENARMLQTLPSGYVRYVPLASQWESMVANSPAADCLKNFETDITEDDDDLQIPLAQNRSISRAELLTVLPPGRYCDSLKDVYFRVVSPVFHILHDLTFDAEYQQFRHDPGSVSMAWLALLFAILAIAVSALDDDDPLLSDLGRERTVSRNIKVLSARYRSAVLRCLAADGIVSRHSINSLQALVLINYARIQRGLPIWTLLGFTRHVAISMGCHVDPDRFTLGAIEREERRRVWAGLVTLFTIQNSAFGSLDQQLLSQDVKMPADVDDVDLLTGPSSTVTSADTTPPVPRPTQMTYLLLSFRLHRISAKICDTIFSHPHTSRFSPSQLEAELFAVREMCGARYHSDPNHEALPAHHQANLNILYSHIHQLLLLLLRPDLCRYLQGEVTQETCAARAKCIASAKASLAIFQTLFESSQFAPYKWYTSGLGSFHAFQAAVALAVVLLQPETQDEFDGIKKILDRALEIFASLSVRSIYCSKAVPIIRQIMDIASSHYPHHQPRTHARLSHQQQQQQQQQAQNQILTTMPSTGSPVVHMSDNFIFSQAQSTNSQSPVPTVADSESDPTIHQPGFGAAAQLQHPQNWLGQTSVPWDAMGSTLDQFRYDPGPS